MDNHEPHEIDPVTAFDTLYTSNQMQMLKIVLPFMQEQMQRFIAIYIKLTELMITLRFAGSLSDSSCFTKKESDMTTMLKYLSPYLSDSEKEMMNQFSSIWAIHLNQLWRVSYLRNKWQCLKCLGRIYHERQHAMDAGCPHSRHP